MYVDIFINRVGLYVNLMLQFNRLGLNLIILIVVFIMLFISAGRLWLYIVIFFSVSFKLKYLNFINVFIFGFFKVHIIIFYIASIVGYLIIFSNHSIQLRLKLNKNSFFIGVAFLLGSLWSLYLFNWGYYWTNDSIEYILLFVITYQIIVIHLWKRSIYLIGLYILLNVCILFMVRLNMIYTRHNFFQQSTLIYSNIKLVYLLVGQGFIYTNFFSKFFIYRFNILGISIYIIIFLIIINFINLSHLKLFMYSCYTIIFFVLILISKWGTSKYLYIHLISFSVYFCFIIFFINYFFYFKLGSSGNPFLYYNYFLTKHIVVYSNFSMLFKFNTLNDNTLFNKFNNLIYPHTTSFTPLKVLTNFVI